MKNRFVRASALSVVVVASACGSATTITEGAGTSIYYFENLSSRTLEVRITSAPGSALETVAIHCAAGTTCRLGQESIIGVSPLPSDSMSTVAAFEQVSGGWVERFRQDPVVDERWTSGDKPVQWESCCKNRTITLSVAESDLQ